MIRKGQARRVNGSDVRPQIQFINTLFEGGCMRRSPGDSTNRSLAAFESCNRTPIDATSGRTTKAARQES